MPYPQNDQKITSQRSAFQQILLGEDDADDEELLKELFASVDDAFSLVFINNGRRLVDYLYAAPDHGMPCLIVLDYNMPELNGEEILKALKGNARFAHIPKIIWTTSQSESYKRKCLDAGADDYIIKPASVNELIEAIRYITSFC